MSDPQVGRKASVREWLRLLRRSAGQARRALASAGHVQRMRLVAADAVTAHRLRALGAPRVPCLRPCLRVAGPGHDSGALQLPGLIQASGGQSAGILGLLSANRHARIRT